MRYIDAVCVHCAKTFREEDDVVTCPTCGSPHHRACWKERGQCANAALHGEGFVWKLPVREEEKKELQPTQKENGEKTTECPFCGAQNYENELYCTVCHEPIHRNASADAGEPLQSEGQREKVYADFQKYGGLDPNSGIGDISVREYAAYLGKNAGAYIRRFQNMQNTNGFLSWNFSAFLLSAVAMFSSVVLGPVWFFYRRLNKVGAIFLALLLALGVVTAIVYTVDPAYVEYVQGTKDIYLQYMEKAQTGMVDVASLIEEMQVNIIDRSETFIENSAKLTNAWSYAVNILQSYVIPVLAGLFATFFYFKKTKKDILSVREQHRQSPDYLQRLSLKGGVSVGGAVVSAVLCFAVLLVQQYLPLVLIAITG